MGQIQSQVNGAIDSIASFNTTKRRLEEKQSGIKVYNQNAAKADKSLTEKQEQFEAQSNIMNQNAASSGGANV